MELSERKEQKQKEMEGLMRKHKSLIKYVDELKKKSRTLDQELVRLEEKKAALRERLDDNWIADEFDQLKESYRPKKSFQDKPQPLSSGSGSGEPVEKYSSEPEERPEDISEHLPALEAESNAPIEHVQDTDDIIQTPDQDIGDPPEETAQALEDVPDVYEEPPLTLPANYLMSQKELLELIQSISQQMDHRPVEEIVVRKVSAGAKIIEIFHDMIDKFFKLLIFAALMLLVSLAVTVLINPNLRNTMLDFLKSIGV